MEANILQSEDYQKAEKRRKAKKQKEVDEFDLGFDDDDDMLYNEVRHLLKV